MADESSTESVRKEDGRVDIKRSLNLLGAMAMIVGAIVGSGIYISPKGVLVYTGSVGLNMIVWALCGLIAMGGGFCFAELGTLVRENGGQWAYIRMGLGDAPAFVVAWTGIVMTSVGSAVITLASGEYILSSFYGDCGTPEVAAKITGILILWLALYINTSVRLASKILKVLLIMKVVSMVFIIAGGIYWMLAKGTSKLSNSFEGTTDNAWSVAVAFYSGLWAYDGWETANYVTEEVKNVKRTMPRAIIGSTVLIICLYLMMNVSYYSVLTRSEVLTSSAVAVDWGDKIIGSWSKLFSVIVSLSIFGSAIASVFGNSRILMAVAREGHTVELLSMVSIDDSAPIISLLVRGVLATAAAIIGDLSSLIDFFGFCNWLFYGMCFLSLIILRFKKYKADDPDVFRVPIVLPFIMLSVSIYLVVVPIAANPQLSFIFAIIFMFCGLFFYFPFVYCKVKAKWFEKVTVFFQILFRVSRPKKDV